METEKIIRLSVRNLVEFILKEGDIDNRISGTLDKDAMLMGGRLHRKIQRMMGSNYQAEVSLKLQLPCDGFQLKLEGRADGILLESEKTIIDEIKGVVALINEVYSLFGFEYHVELSTRPEDSMGSDEDWEMATEGLRSALDEIGLPYVVNEGDGAFYGPKIDFHLVDCIGRTWQCGTIQLDFQLPQRFELEYIGADGEKHRPIMIHRVVFGSIERFIGILIEHFAGAFPTWLAPVQVKVLPISDKYMDYAEKVKAALDAENIRVEVDTRSEKIGYKIREAQKNKIPYMLVVGQKEEEDGVVSVRSRFKGDEGQASLESFIENIKKEIVSREARAVEVKAEQK